MIYLSIPYTGHEYLSFRVSCAVAAKLIEAGNIVIAPIVCGHAIAKENHLLYYDCNLWLKHDLEMLHHCTQVAVVKLEGWEESVGVQAEIAEAKKLDIPVVYLDPMWFISADLMEIWSDMGFKYKDANLAEIAVYGGDR